jgi:hypothetical protein
MAGAPNRASCLVQSHEAPPRGPDGRTAAFPPGCYTHLAGNSSGRKPPNPTSGLWPVSLTGKGMAVSPRRDARCAALTFVTDGAYFVWHRRSRVRVERWLTGRGRCPVGPNERGAAAPSFGLVLGLRRALLLNQAESGPGSPLLSGVFASGERGRGEESYCRDEESDENDDATAIHPKNPPESVGKRRRLRLRSAVAIPRKGDRPIAGSAAFTGRTRRPVGRVFGSSACGYGLIRPTVDPKLRPASCTACFDLSSPVRVLLLACWSRHSPAAGGFLRDRSAS